MLRALWRAGAWDALPSPLYTRSTMGMIRSILSKVAWVGRTASMVFGLALVLALVLGIASMAFGANGGNFILGKTNVATLLTKLGGKQGVNGAMFAIQNNNTGTDDTALSLKVQPGEPPMKVNSSKQVAALNADQVDGRNASEFVTSNNVYTVGSGQEQLGTLLGDGTRVINQHCNGGDRLLSGGPASVDPGSKVLNTYPSDAITWTARINPAAGDTWTVV